VFHVMGTGGRGGKKQKKTVWPRRKKGFFCLRKSYLSFLSYKRGFAEEKEKVAFSVCAWDKTATDEGLASAS